VEAVWRGCLRWTILDEDFAVIESMQPAKEELPEVEEEVEDREKVSGEEAREQSGSTQAGRFSLRAQGIQFSDSMVLLS
jgi:hypothetical protein